MSVNGIVTIATGTTNWTAAVALQPELNIVQCHRRGRRGQCFFPDDASMSIICTPTVANDFFVSAASFPLTGSSGIVSNNNANATKEAGEPDHRRKPWRQIHLVVVQMHQRTAC